MSGLASAAGAYEVAEGKDAYVRRSRFVGDDREQEDDITLLTLQRSEVS
jgi:hypothetical protein